MSRYTGFALTMVLGLSLATVACAVEQPQKVTSNAALDKQASQPDTANAAGDMLNRAVTGEIVRIEAASADAPSAGQWYVVKDASGKEVRLHVDATTMREQDGVPSDALKAGDKIEAEVTAKGHARLLKKVRTEFGSTSTPTPK